MIVGLGTIIWYLAFSRLPWRDRLWGLGTLVAGGLVWMIVTRGAVSTLGRAGLLAASVLSWGYFTLLRVDGIDGNLSAETSWRWSPTAEDTFLAQRRTLESSLRETTDPDAPPIFPLHVAEKESTSADWPEFRGPQRDGTVRGVSIAADWSQQPPREIWRRRVGPGWSSFAVIGNRAFTQEQRGEAEAVVCFDLTNGQEVWSHEDQARFWEVVAGAGPRATPTIHKGRVYSLGGSGKLNCLTATTGALVWSRDLLADGGLESPPQWGFSSSPLIAQDIVTVFAGGKDGKSVLGYDAATGELKWFGGKGTHSYSSPQLFHAGGAAADADAEQVLMISDHGLEAFHPTSGKLLWEHDWNLQGIFRVCQPLVVDNSQVLVGTGMGHGTRLLKIDRAGDGWQATAVWTSRDLKPYFNDFVQHGDFLYGFDGSILVCIDLATGKKQWKKGRYGHGQMLLVGDAGLLVIVSETGEAILAEATPQDLVERGKFQALSGKTWNHPVIARGRLFRNGEEMVCYDVAAKTQAEVPK